MNNNNPKTMTDEEIVSAFLSINQGTSKGSPALHKPLLLLFMLGQCWNNNNRLLLFQELYPQFDNLLKEFGGPGIDDYSAFLPFWFLRKTSSDIWITVGESTLGNWTTMPDGTPRRRPPFTLVMDSQLLGGFTPQIYRRLCNDRVMLLEVVFAMLNHFFPVSMHIPLLQAITVPSVAKSRDFHQEILSIYKYSCSVCNYPYTGKEDNVDLRVAYFQPPAAGGPQHRTNSITLCDKHKNLLDYGAFTVTAHKDILVSDQFKNLDVSKHLAQYARKKATFPDTETDWPSTEYLSWHKEKVFSHQF